MHLGEHGPLESLLPERQVGAQLHAERVAPAVTHQHAEAERLTVPWLTVLLQAQVQLRLDPAVFGDP